MSDTVKCPMCGNDNMVVVWTERCAARVFMNGGKLSAINDNKMEPTQLGDEKIVCLDCDYDKWKAKVEWL